MNIQNADPKFVVYMHVSPADKRYIGITARRLIERWGSDGRGYRNNKHFWSAIQKYGWDSFKHEIIDTGLSLEAASNLEMQLISKYNTTDPEYGYNQTTGGNWSRPTPEVRMRISEAIKRKYRTDPEFHARMIEVNRQSHIGKKLTLAHRRKIGLASKGRFKGVKRKPLSEAARAKLRGRPSWSKGLTKDTDPRVNQISLSLQGRQFNKDTLDRMSSTRLKKFADGYSPVWINNGRVETTYDPNVDSLPDGFIVGRLDRNRRYIYRGSDLLYVDSSELDKYLVDGWQLGRGPAVGETIRKKIQKYVFVVDELRFDTAHQAADYLRSIGYPNIVSSTVTELCRRGFSHSKTYSSLAGRLHKEVVNADQADNQNNI